MVLTETRLVAKRAQRALTYAQQDEKFRGWARLGEVPYQMDSSTGVFECSAIIPTTLRGSLPNAIESARAQRGASVEIIAAVDRDPSLCSKAELAYANRADRVVFTGGRRGASAARNLGVESSNAAWCAFLDDDDEWHPLKISKQLTVARAGVGEVVVSSRYTHDRDFYRPQSVAPRAVYADQGRIEDYLFRKRAPKVGRNAMHTSTLLASRAHCSRVRWDESLSRHQDWDWLVRSQTEGGAKFAQLEDVLTWVALVANGSISASMDWEASLAWAEAHKHWDSQTLADFIAGQPLRYALGARSTIGVRRALSAIKDTRCLPSGSCLALAAAGLAPRSLLVFAVLGRTSGQREGRNPR